MKADTNEKPVFYRGVAAGQLIAFIAAFGGTALRTGEYHLPISFAGSLVELLGDNSLPLFMASCCYALLMCIHGALILRKQGFQIRSAWWKYAILSLIDVAAAYFTLLALRYTSVTSWALMQPASLLAVVPLSMLLLKASYSWKHFFSGMLAFGGLVLLLLSDVSGDDDSSGRSGWVKLSGDLCALLGTSLYGTNSVLVERVVKGNVPQYEVLGMMGVFGFLFSAIAAVSVGEVSADMFPNRYAPLYMLGATAANFGFYSLGVVVLKNAGAAVLQISLLAVNFWSVLGKIFIVGGFHTNLVGFVFALLMVISGVTLFTLSGDPYSKNTIAYTALDSEMAQVASPDPPNTPL